jgi:hypothetical protein
MHTHIGIVDWGGNGNATTCDLVDMAEVVRKLFQFVRGEARVVVQNRIMRRSGGAALGNVNMGYQQQTRTDRMDPSNGACQYWILCNKRAHVRDWR